MEINEEDEIETFLQSAQREDFIATKVGSEQSLRSPKGGLMERPLHMTSEEVKHDSE